MGLKIKPELRIYFESVLEGQVVFDILQKCLGYRVGDGCSTHTEDIVLKKYVRSPVVQIRVTGDVCNLWHYGFPGVKGGETMSFQEFIEYAAKQ